MKVTITNVDGVVFEAMLQNPIATEPVFEVETDDYLFEITNDNGRLYVSNGINGYGHNVRNEFSEAVVEVSNN